MQSFLSNLSIRIKFALGSILIISVISVFIYTYYPVKQKEQAIKAIDFKIESIFNMMKIGVGIGMGGRDLVAISEALEWAKRDPFVTYVVVLDSTGNEISSFNPENLDLNSKTLTQEGGAFDRERIMHYKDKIIYQNISFGTLLLGYSLAGLDEEIDAQRSITLYVCLSISIVGTILSIIFSNGITDSIRKLDNAVKKMTIGDTNLQFDINSNDEVGKLAQAFNDMIGSLSHSHNELVKSQGFTENIIMSMLNLLIVLDKNNLIIRVNQTFSDLLEYNNEDIVGKPFSIILKDEEQLARFFNLLIANKRLQNEECIITSKSGRLIIVLLSASLLKDEKERKEGIVLVAQDISERKQSEKKLRDYSIRLEKINRELSEFNYVVSHDLKSPLKAIHNLAEWIEEDLREILPKESKQNLQLLKGRVQRLQNLVVGLLEYSKIGTVFIEPEEVNINTLLKEIIDLLSPPSNFKVEVIEQMPTLITYKIRLFQIFQNLISNAIKYNDKESGSVKIFHEEKDNHYEFTVWDNGPGIETEYHEKVFHIFQRLQARDMFESTGIGLTIVKKVLEEQNGRIWIESEKGLGTSFKFLWPKEVVIADRPITI